ncbi:beta-lactamase superfamily domain-containing protein [Xylariales sp. PMI_506]|nr:beta-lactamase superfamily domain-containing protein [Xylariales sp. PMI_506]
MIRLIMSPMEENNEKCALDIQIERTKNQSSPPHHVVPRQSANSWASYMPSWNTKNNSEQTAPTSSTSGSNTSNSSARVKKNQPEITGFRNPWPSYHKPTRMEIWDALEFGQDQDPCIDLAASSITEFQRLTRAQQAAQLLGTHKPDFSFDQSTQRAKSTWLGHAGVLLQLPSLKPQGSPIRVIFDPIFSERSSPSKYAGPVRSYKLPCKVEDIPQIDLLLISHNHYDHLDYETIMTIWRRNKSHMRIMVPLKNAQWFIDCGIPQERITELDWWESATLSDSTSDATRRLKVSCTPAQHSSVRGGLDANASLWSGWYLDYSSPTNNNQSYRVYFAGDTGYQFHGSPSWPPRPPAGTTHEDLRKQKLAHSAGTLDVAGPGDTPPCPAFKEISERLGQPHLLYLPVALGATWSYLRSFFSDYVPPFAVPFPRHSAGVTGSIHMPAWDAVHVLSEMTSSTEAEAEQGPKQKPVAVAMHWGTFTTDPVEILKTLGQLEWACYQHGVSFGRGVEHEGWNGNEQQQSQQTFLALNHGQSVIT